MPVAEPWTWKWPAAVQQPAAFVAGGCFRSHVIAL